MQTTQRVQTPGAVRPSIKARLASLVTLMLLTSIFSVSAASAQTAQAPPPTPSVNDLKARAYDAQQAQAEAQRAQAEAMQAAETAEAAAADATHRAQEAQRALESAGATATPVIVAPGPPPVPVSTPVPAPAPAPAAAPAATTAATGADLAASRAELERATEEARNAAAAARAATRALEEHMQERKDRYARRGFFLAGGVFYAPELFNTVLTIDNSNGGWGGIGYRFTKRFEAEVRFDWLNGFDVSGFNTEGLVEGWSTTANARLFLLTKSFQPYLGLGLGAMQAKTKLVEVDGPGRVNTEQTVAIFRTFAGFDYYISETFALTLDGAVNLPGGDLSSLTYATISAGVKLRF
ncbi:MAG: porin family protein [Deltaproteobacteria bacterium]|nr:porin family protein [Deltaproteobacteria bacterium]